MRQVEPKQTDKNKILVRASWVSTVGNGVLSISKIVVGLMSGSLAVLGDGIDSATDVVISAVMVFTSRIMNRPPNSKYAYGYEKAESVATKILSLIIFYAGVQILISSVQSIFATEPKQMPTLLAIYVTLFSIVGKLLLAAHQFRMGRRAQSSMLRANAINMRNDVLLSVGVLVGLIFTFVMKMPLLDSITGLLVSLFIIKSSISIFMESNVELMDGVDDLSVYNKIFDAIEEVEGVSNPHRVRTRMVGGMYVIDLDVEADGDISLKKAHTLAHKVDESIRARVPNIYDIVVHVEPVGTCHEDEKYGVDREDVEDVENT